MSLENLDSSNEQGERISLSSLSDRILQLEAQMKCQSIEQICDEINSAPEKNIPSIWK